MKKIGKILRIALIRSCYGRFNSYRVKTVGMQKITELYQFQRGVQALKGSPAY
jgi:hypothetical protein